MLEIVINEFRDICRNLYIQHPNTFKHNKLNYNYKLNYNCTQTLTIKRFIAKKVLS